MAANLRDNFSHTQAQFPHNIQYNEINVYSRNTNENTSEGTGTEDEQIENINDENVGSSDGSSSATVISRIPRLFLVII